MPLRCAGVPSHQKRHEVSPPCFYSGVLPTSSSVPHCYALHARLRNGEHPEGQKDPDAPQFQSTELRYDTRIFPEDYDFFVRAYLAGFKFGNVKETLLYFRLGDNLSEAIKRRWGFKYAINEFKLYRNFFRLGFYNYKDYLKVLIFKIPLRIIPFRLYSYIYFKFSR